MVISIQVVYTMVSLMERVFRVSNGDRYEGEFKSGKRHGEGIYYVSVCILVVCMCQ